MFFHVLDDLWQQTYFCGCEGSLIFHTHIIPFFAAMSDDEGYKYKHGH